MKSHTIRLDFISPRKRFPRLRRVRRLVFGVAIYPMGVKRPFSALLKRDGWEVINDAGQLLTGAILADVLARLEGLES